MPQPQQESIPASLKMHNEKSPEEDSMKNRQASAMVQMKEGRYCLMVANGLLQYTMFGSAYVKS